MTDNHPNGDLGGRKVRLHRLVCTFLASSDKKTRHLIIVCCGNSAQVTKIHRTTNTNVLVVSNYIISK